MVEDVQILLPVELRFILLSGFRGEVKNVKAYTLHCHTPAHAAAPASGCVCTKTLTKKIMTKVKVFKKLVKLQGH